MSLPAPIQAAVKQDGLLLPQEFTPPKEIPRTPRASTPPDIAHYSSKAQVGCVENCTSYA